MTAILRLQLDDKDPVRVNSAINQLAEVIDRGGGGGGARTFLTANTIFYVSTTGSDTNSGTSSGSPFLTIQHAYDVIANTLDLGGNNVKIQCASGTYTTGLSIAQPWTGGGSVTLDLGGGTISSAGGCLLIRSCTLPSQMTIQNGTLTSSAADCVVNQSVGSLSVGTGMTFGASAGVHIGTSLPGAIISVSSSYAITGNALYHYYSQNGLVTITGNPTVTLTGTRAFSGSFARATFGGTLLAPGITFSGTATGTRYIADVNGVIYTAGAGANYFPGNAAGGTPTGGQYI